MKEAAATAVDPRALVAQAPMGTRQKLVVALCVLILAIDGYDVLSIGFAAPAIAAEWDIDRKMLGLVLSMELIGMGFGSVLFGRVADIIGRKPTMIGCLAIIAVGMALASLATGVTSLSIYRLATGLGIGGVLAAANAIASEVSSARAKSAAVTLMASGVPIGGLLGGPVAADFLASGNWPAVFQFGAVVTAVIVPLCWIFLPETPAYLVQGRGSEEVRLTRINAVLARFQIPPVASLPVRDEDGRRGLIGQIVDGGYARTTLLLILAYFLHMLTLYFLMKWLPKIVVDMAYGAADGVAVLLWLNAGGLCGCLLISLASLRLDNRLLVPAALFGTAIAAAIFGQVPNELGWLKLMAAIAGFFGQASVVGFYAIIAQSFPGRLRATGAGLVLGFGRAGAALGPMIAGLLFSAGMMLGTTMLLMALGSLLGAAVLLILRHNRREVY